MSITEIAEFIGYTYTEKAGAFIAIKSVTNPTSSMPFARIEGDPDVIQLILQTEVKTMVKLKGFYLLNCRKYFPLIYGQCTK